MSWQTLRTMWPGKAFLKSARRDTTFHLGSCGKAQVLLSSPRVQASLFRERDNGNHSRYLEQKVIE